MAQLFRRLNPVFSPTVGRADRRRTTVGDPTYGRAKAMATQILMVSNAANNGYGAGNDTTGNGGQLTPYATADKATLMAIDGACIEINPSGTAYFESTSGGGFFRPSATKGLTWGNDPRAGEWVMKGTTTRVVQFDASSKPQAMYGGAIDATGITTGITPINPTGGLTLSGMKFRNVSGSAIIKPTLNNNLITTVDCVFEQTVHFVHSATGGNYDALIFRRTTFQQDNQVWKGAPGAVQTYLEVTACRFLGNPAATGLGVIPAGDTIGNLNFSNNEGSGLWGGPCLNLSTSTNVTGKVTANGNHGSPSAGMIVCNTENIAQTESHYNKLSAGSAQTQDPFVWRVLGGICDFEGNDITIAATTQLHGIAIGGDGYNTDVTNTNAQTTHNLGDVSGRRYLEFAFTMAAITAAIKSSHLAALTLKFKRQASPTGNVWLVIYNDNANAIGATVLDNAAAVIPASIVANTGSGTGITTYSFILPGHYKTTASTKYHARLYYDGTIDGTNYLTLLTGTTVSGGYLSTSADGITWTADTTHCPWHEILTGPFGTTRVSVRKSRVRALAGASATTHGIMIGSVNLTEAYDNEHEGQGIGHLFKNTLGGRIWNLLSTVTGGTQGCLYLKGCSGQEIYHPTLLNTSTDGDISACILGGSNSELGANAPLPSGITIKNHIVSARGIGAPYNFDPGASAGITLDHGVVYSTSGFAIERVTNPSAATWQGLGFDVNSVFTNPLIATLPTQPSDYAPASTSPAGGRGVNLGGLVPLDFSGVAFPNPPPAGALNLLP